MTKTAAAIRVTEIGEVSNGAEAAIDLSQPYVASVTIQGNCDFLFHRWNVEAVEEKSKSAKGSRAKKSDYVEGYVYRNDDGELCIPGEYLRQSIIHSARFRQDPRSPRKSAMDLYRAGVQSITQFAGLGKSDWDYEDRRRVVVQRNGVTRTRPAMKSGWQIEVNLLILLPEYIPPTDLHDVITNAGRLIGIGDFRPTYGRFQVTKWELRGE